MVEIGAIMGRPEWRLPIYYIPQNGQMPEHPRAPKKTFYAKFCLIGDFLHRRTFTHPCLRCLAEHEGKYILRQIHEGCVGNHTGFKNLAHSPKGQILLAYYKLRSQKLSQEMFKVPTKCEINTHSGRGARDNALTMPI